MFQQQLYAIADVFGATRSPRVGDQQVGARLTDVVPSPPARRVVRGASAPSVSSGHPNPTTLVAWKFPDAPPDTPAARPDVSGFAGYDRARVHCPTTYFSTTYPTTYFSKDFTLRAARQSLLLRPHEYRREVQKATLLISPRSGFSDFRTAFSFVLTSTG